MAPGWHPGVVGIIAGRIKQRQNRPALAGALAQGVVRGSGRSVEGRRSRQPRCWKPGGLGLLSHRRAVTRWRPGSAWRKTSLAEFHSFLEERLAHAAASAARTLICRIEATVSGRLARALELAGQIDRLAPFRGRAMRNRRMALPRARVVPVPTGSGVTGARLRADRGGGGRVLAGSRRWRSGLAGRRWGRRFRLRVRRCIWPARCGAEEWNGVVSASFVVSDAAAA